MNSTTFHHHLFGDLTLKLDNDTPLFPAKECASLLGYVKTRNAIQQHCNHVVKLQVPHPQNPEKTGLKQFIPESDLYALIMHSQLPEAERFQAWVYEEVLPSIRKTGGYTQPNREEEFFRKHYDYLDPELMKQVLEATHAYAKKMEAENQQLTTKVKMLAKEATTWKPRSFLNATIRKFSMQQFYGETFVRMANGWKTFYQRLYYDHGINLAHRFYDCVRDKNVGKGGPKINKIKEEELPLAVKTAISLCEDYHVDISDLLIHNPYAEDNAA